MVRSPLLFQNFWFSAISNIKRVDLMSCLKVKKPWLSQNMSTAQRKTAGDSWQMTASVDFIPIQIFQSNQFLNRKGAFSEPIDMSKKTLLVTWEKPIASKQATVAPGDLYILASYMYTTYTVLDYCCLIIYASMHVHKCDSSVYMYKGSIATTNPTCSCIVFKLKPV